MYGRAFGRKCHEHSHALTYLYWNVTKTHMNWLIYIMTSKKTEFLAHLPASVQQSMGVHLGRKYHEHTHELTYLCNDPKKNNQNFLHSWLHRCSKVWTCILGENVTNTHTNWRIHIMIRGKKKQNFLHIWLHRCNKVWTYILGRRLAPRNGVSWWKFPIISSKISVCTCVYVCIYVCIPTCVCVCVCAYVEESIAPRNGVGWWKFLIMSSKIWVCTCVYVYIYISLHVCVCVWERERERERVCVCVCECVWWRAPAHAHTHRKHIIQNETHLPQTIR